MGYFLKKVFLFHTILFLFYIPSIIGKQQQKLSDNKSSKKTYSEESHVKSEYALLLMSIENLNHGLFA